MSPFHSQVHTIIPTCVLTLMHEVMHWLCLSHACIHRPFWKGGNNPSRSHTNSAGLQSWSALFLCINSLIWIYTVQELAVLQCITRMAAVIFQQVWCKLTGLGWWLDGLWIQCQIWWREWQSSKEHNKEIPVKTSKCVPLDRQEHALSFSGTKSPSLSGLFWVKNALSCYHLILLNPASSGLQAFDYRLCNHRYYWVAVSREDTIKSEDKREGKISGIGKTGQSQVRSFLSAHLTKI